MSSAVDCMVDMAQIIANGDSQAASAAVEECHRIIENEVHNPNSYETESTGENSKKID